MRLALGIGPLLDGFAQRHEALTYTHWDVTRWQAVLPELAADKSTEVLWNLTEVDIELGLHRAVLAQEAGSRAVFFTDWELLQFCMSSEWRTRCRFFLEDVEVADPFDAIGWCDHGDN